MTPQSSAFQAKEAGCSRQPASFACLNFNINHDAIHASDFLNISGDRLMLRVRPVGFERGTVFEANRQHDLIALIFSPRNSGLLEDRRFPSDDSAAL